MKTPALEPDYFFFFVFPARFFLAGRIFDFVFVFAVADRFTGFALRLDIVFGAFGAFGRAFVLLRPAFDAFFTFVGFDFFAGFFFGAAAAFAFFAGFAFRVAGAVFTRAPRGEAAVERSPWVQRYWPVGIPSTTLASQDRNGPYALHSA